MHREPTMEYGDVIRGRHPQIGVVCPNTHKTEKQPPHNMQCAKTMQEHRSMGAPGGVYTPRGCMNIWEVYKHTGGVQRYRGVYKYGGVQPPPPQV